MKKKTEPRRALNVVLGAVMKWDREKKEWTFPPIVDEYPGKLVMGEYRAEAAALTYETAPIMLVTGGPQIHPETGEECSRAEELRKRIIRYGVPQEKILAIGKSLKERGNTLGNSQDIVDYIEQNESVLEGSGDYPRIGILCPLFQAPRAKIMFGMNDFFKKRRITLDWMMVEHTLALRDKSRWMEFKRLYNTPEAKINREMEEQGIQALLSGNYSPRDYVAQVT